MSGFVHNSGNNQAEALTLRFADGTYRVPAHIVAQAGGTKKVRELAAQLTSYTFTQFVSAASEEAMAVRLRAFQNTLARANRTRPYLVPQPPSTK